MESIPKRGTPQIHIPKEKIVAFCKSHNITNLALFGSVLTDHFTDKSDVDVLVEFEPSHVPGFFGIVAMEDELSTIVGRQADLRTPKDLSRYFRNDVLQQAYLLYGKGQFRTH
ncbi:MAG: nucleotidyltransferase family protein [Parachlamydia sp.]|nr:nucleotidyltransferase family protein [Parachlamydia sp.]